MQGQGAQYTRNYMAGERCARCAHLPYLLAHSGLRRFDNRLHVTSLCKSALHLEPKSA